MERMCYECGNDSFKEINVLKSVKVKELELKSSIIILYVQIVGERYADFDRPNENLIRNYNEYRHVKTG